MAMKYYVNDIPTNNRKMPFKKCNDEVKKAFFPAEDILHYVETFNEKHFGGEIDNVEFIDEAMDNHLVQKTPYWFISILQTTNYDCLSHAITILHNHYEKIGSNSSLCHLIVGIKRYIDIISLIEPATVDPKERRMREEYSQYLLTLKNIVKNLMTLLNESQCMMVIDKQLEEKLFTILDEIQYKINTRRNTNSSRGSKKIPAKEYNSSSKNSDKQAKEFSFKASSNSSNVKRLTESSHQADSVQNFSEKSQKPAFPKEESKYNYDSEDSIIDTSNRKGETFESRRPRRSKEQMYQPSPISGGQGPPKLF